VLTLVFLPALYAAWFRVPAAESLDPQEHEGGEAPSKMAA
jgi:hypothetical protein